MEGIIGSIGEAGESIIRGGGLRVCSWDWRA